MQERNIRSAKLHSPVFIPGFANLKEQLHLGPNISKMTLVDGYLVVILVDVKTKATTEVVIPLANVVQLLPFPEPTAAPKAK